MDRRRARVRPTRTPAATARRTRWDRTSHRAWQVFEHRQAAGAGPPPSLRVGRPGLSLAFGGPKPDPRRDGLDAAHVGAEDVRDGDGAVRLLVVLQNGDKRAGQGEAGAVERMRVLRAGPLFAAEADVGATGLGVRAVGG